MGRQNERTGPLMECTPQGSFFVVSGGAARCVGGSVGGNPTPFQKKVRNSSRKSHEDLKSANTLSVFLDRCTERSLD